MNSFVFSMVYHSGFHLLCVTSMMTTIIINVNVVMHDRLVNDEVETRWRVLIFIPCISSTWHP